MARLGVLGAPEVHTSEILHCVKDDWVQWFAAFIRDTLLRHAAVQDCKTSFVLERVKGRGG